MTSARNESVAIPRQVHRVEKALRETYLETGLIYSGDLDGKAAEEREPRLLSRALTAQAVRIITGWSPADAAVAVIDGLNDHGIDAIAVVGDPDPHVYLVQSKWSKKARASSDREAVLEMAAGLRLIDNEAFGEFNLRGSQLAEDAKNALDSGPVPLTQVYALMRDTPVTQGFNQAVEQVKADFNRTGEMAYHRTILAAEIYDSILRDLAPPPIDLEIDLSPWYEISSPYRSFQGIALAEQVASWYEHGSSLFDRNIRNPLGRTPINGELISTLTNEPVYFWYFNNGITILCDDVEVREQSRFSPQARPVLLKLKNASVVNGAQTVRAVAEGLAESPEAASASVSVRVIVTAAETDFATRTTQATNRQNRVEARDFIALDPRQSALAEEMRAELGLEYSVRRGELAPQGDEGCSVVEAASALACFHSDAQYAARIATTLDVLWERGSQGIYDVVFTPEASVYRIWHTVRVLRAVRLALHGIRSRYEGRGAALIEHGVYLLAHLTFRRLEVDDIDEPDPEGGWLATALEQVPAIVEQLVPEVAEAIDDLYTSGSRVRAVCADIDRCREISERIRRGTLGVSDSVEHDRYRRQPVLRKRRPNAVTVLVDHGVLEEGAPLVLARGSATEDAAMRDWLAANVKRSQATWVPHRTKPILWSADGRAYSPSGLISHMWDLADWDGRPVAVQGTGRWITGAGITLADLAWQTLEELDDPDADDGASQVSVAVAD